MTDLDENGLETIDLTDDIGATTTGQPYGEKPQPSVISTSPQTMPGRDFSKTKSNNFFAVDDSQDQIKPFEDDEDECESERLKRENQAWIQASP